MLMKRFVKRAVSVDHYKIHVIDLNAELWVSCSELAALFWNNKDEGHLFQRLHFKRYDLPTQKLNASSNSDMYYQIKKFQVKGVKGFDEDAHLFVTPLKKVAEVLNVLGHPSVPLRNMVQFELENFNSENPVWQEFHDNVPDLLKELNMHSLTEDNKLERLCLSDLVTMKERVVAELCRNSNGQEATRMRKLIGKITERILQISEICERFRYAV